MDERAHVVCCQFADAEQLEHEPDLFDCETCPVAGALADLWPENRDAWAHYQQFACRVVQEAHLSGALFDRVTADLSDEDVRTLIQRLDRIHDLVAPKKSHA